MTATAGTWSSVATVALVDAIASRIAANPTSRISSRRHTGDLRTSSCAELWLRSAEIGSALAAQPAQNVVLLLDDIVDFVPALWGCLRSGRTAVPLTGAAQAALAGRPQAWEAVTDLDSPVILADDTFADFAAETSPASVLDLRAATGTAALGSHPPAGPACIIQTSGSTGLPRFAALSATALHARSFRLPQTDETVVCGFGFDAITGFRPSTVGCAHWVQVPPTSAFGDPLSMLDAAEDTAATGMLMSTALARLILDQRASGTRRWDLSNLQWIAWGLERIDASTARDLGVLLTRHGAVDLRFKRGYGTTETGLISSAEDDWDIPMTDVGQIVEGKDARIVDGAIQVKDYPGMFSGYVGEPAGHPHGFTPDRWWDTGDRGDIVGRTVTVTGRTKEVVIVRGAKHSLPAIERAVSEAFAGVTVHACAIDDSRGGTERLGLAVVAPEPSTEAVAALIARRFALTADPIAQFDAAEIPRASNGKVQRASLAQQLLARTPSTPALLLGERGTRDRHAPATMAAALTQRFATDPDQRLITYSLSGEVTIRDTADLWHRAGEIAGGLREAGVQPGTPVVLTIGDTFRFVTALWGGIRAGCTIVPLGAVANAMRGTELSGLLTQLDHPVVLIDDRFTDVSADVRALRLEELAGRWDNDAPAADPLLLLQTSGTTGTPKLAMVSESAFLNRHFLTTERPAHRDVVVGVFTGLRAAIVDAGTYVDIPPAAVAGSPLLVLDGIERFGGTCLMINNSFARRIVSEARRSSRRWDLSTLKVVSFSGETIVSAVARQFSDLLATHGAPSVDFTAYWGTIEAGRHAGGHDPRQSTTDTAFVGGPAAGVDIRVVDPERHLLGEGEVGAVEIRSESRLFTRYWVQSEPAREADSWWHSGDRAVIENGSIRLLGRMDEDLGPGRPSLTEIDAHLQSVLDPGISAYSCITDDGVAVVVVAPDHDSSTAAAEIREQALLRFGIAVDVAEAQALHDIPFTQFGKVRRSALAQRVRSGRLARSSESSRGPARSVTERIWRDIMGVAGPLESGATFASLGGDSLRAAQLFAEIESVLGVRVPVATFFAEATLDNLERLVARGSVMEQRDPGASRADELIRKQLVHLAAWPGVRASGDPLLTGLNLGGSKPPIAWVFQGAAEFTTLADALGPDQPLYGFRSGHALMKYDEDDIQVFALRYARALESACPEGPIIVGGNCQGGVIGLALAQHLVRRGRDVPLLVLLDWLTRLQPYTGEVLVVHGEDEAHRIPYRQSRARLQRGHRLFRRVSVATLPAAHGHYFEPANAARLARILTSHVERTQRARRPLLHWIRKDRR